MLSYSRGRKVGAGTFSCFCFIFLFVLSLPAPARGGEGGKEKSRFCLVIPPKIREAAQKDTRIVVSPTRSEVSATVAEKNSFFEGNMKKVGIGTPDCFAIGQQEERVYSFAHPDMMYRNLNGYVEALNGDLEIRPFFPTAGYFNRVSREGKSAVALGVGVMGGPATALQQQPPSSPSAGVSLMIGFGF